MRLNTSFLRVPGLYFALTLASILGGKTFWNASWKQDDGEISLILNASFMHERNEAPRVTQFPPSYSNGSTSWTFNNSGENE